MQKTKYLIIGQGLAGSLLSYQFYKHSIPHKVVSSKILPSATGVAAGMFNPLVFKRLTKSWMIDNLLPEMQSTFNELENLLKEKIIHYIPIAKLINSHEKEWWQSRIEAQKLQKYFKGFQSIAPNSGINKDFEMALVNHSGWVDLKIFVSAYKQLLLEKNMFISDDFNYNDIIINNGRVKWKNISADKLICCKGSFSNDNPYFPDNVFYLTKGDVLTAEIQGLNTNHIINKDVFILPKGNNLFVIGSTYIHNDTTWNINHESKDYLLQKAQKLIDLPIKVISHNVGIRPTVKDRRPILGLHYKYKNLAFFNGLGTKGVMLAPYFAKQMFNFLENETFEINSEVNIDRFWNSPDK